MSNHTGQTIPTTITLEALCGHVFAKVDGKVVATTADTQGFIKRIDRQMRAEGILRESGYTTTETERLDRQMVATGWILR